MKRQQQKKNIDNWTIDNKPWKFFKEIFQERTSKDVEPCLLYTSDAADEAPHV